MCLGRFNSQVPNSQNRFPVIVSREFIFFILGKGKAVFGGRSCDVEYISECRAQKLHSIS
jgi:hypothetical protein